MSSSNPSWHDLGQETCQRCGLKTSDLALFQAHHCKTRAPCKTTSSRTYMVSCAHSVIPAHGKSFNPDTVAATIPNSLAPATITAAMLHSIVSATVSATMPNTFAPATVSATIPNKFAPASISAAMLNVSAPVSANMPNSFAPATVPGSFAPAAVSAIKPMSLGSSYAVNPTEAGISYNRSTQQFTCSLCRLDLKKTEFVFHLRDHLSPKSQIPIPEKVMKLMRTAKTRGKAFYKASNPCITPNTNMETLTVTSPQILKTNSNNFQSRIQSNNIALSASVVAPKGKSDQVSRQKERSNTSNMHTQQSSSGAHPRNLTFLVPVTDPRKHNHPIVVPVAPMVPVSLNSGLQSPFIANLTHVPQNAVPQLARVIVPPSQTTPQIRHASQSVTNETLKSGPHDGQIKLLQSFTNQPTVPQSIMPPHSIFASNNFDFAGLGENLQIAASTQRLSISLAPSMTYTSSSGRAPVNCGLDSSVLSVQKMSEGEHRVILSQADNTASQSIKVEDLSQNTSQLRIINVVSLATNENDAPDEHQTVLRKMPEKSQQHSHDVMSKTVPELLARNQSQADEFAYLREVKGYFICLKCKMKWRKEYSLFFQHIWREHAHDGDFHCCPKGYTIKCPRLQTIVQEIYKNSQEDMPDNIAHCLNSQSQTVIDGCPLNSQAKGQSTSLAYNAEKQVPPNSTSGTISSNRFTVIDTVASCINKISLSNERASQISPSTMPDISFSPGIAGNQDQGDLREKNSIGIQRQQQGGHFTPDIGKPAVHTLECSKKSDKVTDVQTKGFDAVSEKEWSANTNTEELIESLSELNPQSTSQNIAIATESLAYSNTFEDISEDENDGAEGHTPARPDSALDLSQKEKEPLQRHEECFSTIPTNSNTSSENLCKYCGWKDISGDSLVQHLVNHFGNIQTKMYSCSVLENSHKIAQFQHEKVERIVKMLQISMESGDGNETDFQCACNICETIFDSVEDLRLHMQESLLKMIQCKYCVSYFLDASSWQEHMHTDHPSLTRMYNINTTLLCHLQKTQKANCKQISSKSNLKQHKNAETDQKSMGSKTLETVEINVKSSRANVEGSTLDTSCARIVNSAIINAKNPLNETQPAGEKDSDRVDTEAVEHSQKDPLKTTSDCTVSDPKVSHDLLESDALSRLESRTKQKDRSDMECSVSDTRNDLGSATAESCVIGVHLDNKQDGLTQSVVSNEKVNDLPSCSSTEQGSSSTADSCIGGLNFGSNVSRHTSNAMQEDNEMALISFENKGSDNLRKESEAFPNDASSVNVSDISHPAILTVSGRNRTKNLEDQGVDKTKLQQKSKFFSEETVNGSGLKCSADHILPPTPDHANEGSHSLGSDIQPGMESVYLKEKELAKCTDVVESPVNMDTTSDCILSASILKNRKESNGEATQRNLGAMVAKDSNHEIFLSSESLTQAVSVDDEEFQLTGISSAKSIILQTTDDNFTEVFTKESLKLLRKDYKAEGVKGDGDLRSGYAGFSTETSRVDATTMVGKDQISDTSVSVQTQVENKPQNFGHENQEISGYGSGLSSPSQNIQAVPHPSTESSTKMASEEEKSKLFPLRCHVCDSLSKTAEDFYNHIMLSKHNIPHAVQPSSDVNGVKCFHCGYVARGSLDLANHITGTHCRVDTLTESSEQPDHNLSLQDMEKLIDVCGTDELDSLLKPLYETDDEKYICFQCKKHFMRPKQLHCHLLSCQAGMGVALCTYCNYQGELTKDVLGHIKENHSITDKILTVKYKTVNKQQFLQALRSKSVTLETFRDICDPFDVNSGFLTTTEQSGDTAGDDRDSSFGGSAASELHSAIRSTIIGSAGILVSSMQHEGELDNVPESKTEIENNISCGNATGSDSSVKATETKPCGKEQNKGLDAVDDPLIRTGRPPEFEPEKCFHPGNEESTMNRKKSDDNADRQVRDRSIGSSHLMGRQTDVMKSIHSKQDNESIIQKSARKTDHLRSQLLKSEAKTEKMASIQSRSPVSEREDTNEIIIENSDSAFGELDHFRTEGQNDTVYHLSQTAERWYISDSVSGSEKKCKKRKLPDRKDCGENVAEICSVYQTSAQDKAVGKGVNGPENSLKKMILEDQTNINMLSGNVEKLGIQEVVAKSTHHRDNEITMSIMSTSKAVRGKPKHNESEICRLALKQTSSQNEVQPHIQRKLPTLTKGIIPQHNVNPVNRNEASKRKLEVHQNTCSKDPKMQKVVSASEQKTVTNSSDIKNDIDIFRCSQCPSYRSYSITTLKLHIKSEHSGAAKVVKIANLRKPVKSAKHRLPSKQKQTVYRCIHHKCDFLGEWNEGVLKGHIHEKHPYYTCGYCHSPYTNLEYLQNHQKFVHRGKSSNIVSDDIALEKLFLPLYGCDKNVSKVTEVNIRGSSKPPQENTCVKGHRNTPHKDKREVQGSVKFSSSNGTFEHKKHALNQSALGHSKQIKDSITDSPMVNGDELSPAREVVYTNNSAGITPRPLGSSGFHLAAPASRQIEMTVNDHKGNDIDQGRVSSYSIGQHAENKTSIKVTDQFSLKTNQQKDNGEPVAKMHRNKMSATVCEKRGIRKDQASVSGKNEQDERYKSGRDVSVSGSKIHLLEQLRRKKEEKTYSSATGIKDSHEWAKQSAAKAILEQNTNRQIEKCTQKLPAAGVRTEPVPGISAEIAGKEEPSSMKRKSPQRDKTLVHVNPSLKPAESMGGRGGFSSVKINVKGNISNKQIQEGNFHSEKPVGETSAQNTENRTQRGSDSISGNSVILVSDHSTQNHDKSLLEENGGQSPSSHVSLDKPGGEDSEMSAAEHNSNVAQTTVTMAEGRSLIGVTNPPVESNNSSAGDKKTQLKRKKVLSVKEYPFRCIRCDLFIRSMYAAEEHFKQLHPTERAKVTERKTMFIYTTSGFCLGGDLHKMLPRECHLCQFCPFRSEDRSTTEAHTRSCHADKEMNIVTLHGPLYQSLGNTTEDSMAVEGESLAASPVLKPSRPSILWYQCHLCSQVSDSKFSFKFHLAKHPSFQKVETLTNTAELLICCICHYIAKSSSDLAEHIGQHMGERRYMCSLCKADEHTRKGVESHIRKMHKDDDAEVIDREKLYAHDARLKLVDLDPTVSLVDPLRQHPNYFQKLVLKHGIRMVDLPRGICGNILAHNNDMFFDTNFYN